MKKILVPLGNSEKAVNTLQYAIDFASISKAKIYVVQVFESVKSTGFLKKIDEFIEVEAKHELSKILSQVDKKDVEIISKVFKGKITDSISVIAEALEVDIIISSASYTSADSSTYLGPIVGGLVKKTELPILIIPKGYKFKHYKNILLSIRSGLINKTHVLDPLKDLVSIFKAKVNLLHVITPSNTTEDNSLHEDFEALANKISNSENATVYQGVLEHLIEVSPDLLCVIRRKRGFFAKLWEQNSIKKIDFESRIPLLVLRGNV